MSAATLTSEARGEAGSPRRRPAPAAILGALPPSALILAGIISVQVGAGLAKQLFTVAAPAAVTLLRLWASAIVMVLGSARAVWRAVRRPATAGPAAWRSLAVAAVFGLTLALMNFSIYQSFARIPLGVAVTIEFLGPLGVAISASRRPLDVVWVVLAGTGVALLTGEGGHVTPAGVLFALVAAGCWAAYILLSAATGRRFAGSTGLCIAMLAGAVVITPVGALSGGSALLRPRVLLTGFGIGLLSSVIPYSFELEALRRMPPRVFGILMSLEPAVAAIVGLVLLGQVLSAREWFAIGCVMVACTGATRGAAESTPEA